MKWTVYTVTTSVEAEDYVCAALMELGFEGVEILDNVPLTEAEAKAQFIDIPLVCDESDTTHIASHSLPSSAYANGVIL